MSIDLGLVPMTPQTGHCARAASQALLKELLGKGLARRGVSGCVASAGQALWGLACLRAFPIGAATISEIYFGIWSIRGIQLAAQALIGAESHLTELDRIVGDGDMGISLARPGKWNIGTWVNDPEAQRARAFLAGCQGMSDLGAAKGDRTMLDALACLQA